MPAPSDVKLGYYVPLPPKADKVDELVPLLKASYELAKEEEGTIQWFAIKIDGETPSFAIIDSFYNEEDQEAHIKGKIPTTVMPKVVPLLTKPGLQKVTFLASKVVVPSESVRATKNAGLTCGVQVMLFAKPGKFEDLKEFLVNALPLVEAEPETLVWYALELPDMPDALAIIDAFPSEKARQAHLNGKVAAALFGPGKELLKEDPAVEQFDIIAAKV